MVEVSLEQLVRFDVTGWRSKPSGDPSVVVWIPPEGNGVGLYFFQVEPDLPRVETLAEMRSFEQERLHVEGTGLVEHHVVDEHNCRAVRSIIKMATDPTIALARSGLTYVGSLTIPFERMSFVIKTQAREVGPTGTRESTVLAQALGTGRVVAAGPGQLEGWIPVPEGGGSLDANLAEQREFDATFPGHPLTKVRALIDRIEASLHIDDLLLREAAFPLPHR